MNKMLKPVGLVLFIGVCIFLIYDATNKTYYDPHLGVDVPKSYPLVGLDVSHHQGEIDFEKLGAFQFHDTLSFVYIKASEGVSHVDRQYKVNAKGFEGIKKPYGFYHFFQPSQSALQQAKHFINSVQSLNSQLKPVLDIELLLPLSTNEMIDSIQVYMSEIEYRLKTKPIIYTYRSYYEDYLKGALDDQVFFWIADYSKNVDLISDNQIVIWQFSDKGKMNGINELVDLNVATRNFDSIVRILK